MTHAPEFSDESTLVATHGHASMCCGNKIPVHRIFGDECHDHLEWIPEWLLITREPLGYEDDRDFYVEQKRQWEYYAADPTKEKVKK